MALWGNNDNRTAQGTVTLDYATGICTGSNQEAYGAGTQFGESGSIQVGDVIRFGDRVKGGGKAYFGEAIVVSGNTNPTYTSFINSTIRIISTARGDTIGEFGVSVSLCLCFTEGRISDTPLRRLRSRERCSSNRNTTEIGSRTNSQ